MNNSAGTKAKGKFTTALTKIVRPDFSRGRKLKKYHLNGFKSESNVPGLVCLTSYPPRECGIATYSQDLLHAIQQIFEGSFNVNICPLEVRNDSHCYAPEINKALCTDNILDFIREANRINSDPNVGMVFIQHEFGLFENNERGFIKYLEIIDKPIVITYHTVLPNPTTIMKEKVRKISSYCHSIIVMTLTSANILTAQYGISENKINVIPHGTHLRCHKDKNVLKEKYGLSGKKVLSTFGLLGPGKSIETTLHALPGIIAENPDVVFLVLGKTHPSLVKKEGEKYRHFLEKKVRDLNIEDYVIFVNQFLELTDLLEYLELTDIYLFTSNDPNQAVSGTFSYALSSGCPVISTPIPHALEVLQNRAGTIFDFGNSHQLEQTVLDLLKNPDKCVVMSHNGLQFSASSSWDNAALAHAKIFEKCCNKINLIYRKPQIQLDHIRRMTTSDGILQFSILDNPDPESGYTLDDNARALILMCQYYQLTGEKSALEFVKIYFNFICLCFRSDGRFLNYMNKDRQFTDQNEEVNLEDACGRALWALGYFLSCSNKFPDFQGIEEKALFVFGRALKVLQNISSPRGMAFIIKGVYFYSKRFEDLFAREIACGLADRLVSMYRHEATDDWKWYESYLTYGNAVLPQALLMASTICNESTYLEVAKESFDFLLSQTFKDNKIQEISNRKWRHRSDPLRTSFLGGEQPINVAYTILALRQFHEKFPDRGYDVRMDGAFNWFLGENSLQQFLYNRSSGGCYDGLELNNVNLNQGAESTISYLLARLAFEDYEKP